MEEESSSLRRLRRCGSSFVASDVSRATAYEKLSQSMRLTDRRCNTTRSGWRSLLNLFSHKKKETTTAQRTADAPPKKRRSCWIPDPHRRWPVQGW